MFRKQMAAGAAFLLMAPAMPAQATVIDFDDIVRVNASNVGMNFVIDYDAKAKGSYTSAVSALGSYTFTGVSNGGLTYNFNYAITNTSSRTSRIRAFGIDSSGIETALSSTGTFTWGYRNVTFPENIGAEDICFSAGSGCTSHSAGGVNKGATGTGTFAVTFANVMESVDFSHFALKFVGVSSKVNGQDWAIGMGHIQSITDGPVSAAPEPETWLMMILGFGLVGYGLRRRVTKALPAHA